MTTDKAYCMSSFLMFRSIVDDSKTFQPGIVPQLYRDEHERLPVCTSGELEKILRSCVMQAVEQGPCALALSGGIDSAILAKYMPKGSVAYTFRCRVPGIEVTDEVPQAALYAQACGLEHRVIEIHWEDFEKFAPLLMRRKGAPIHSIEVQIYLAACRAKADGFDGLIFGDSADVNFGGHDGLLSRDWRMGEFIDRYSYVLPHRALREPRVIVEPFLPYEKDGWIDAHEFIRHEYYRESMGSYRNACDSAGIRFVAPYAHAFLDGALDYVRVRGGESKYLVREIFARLYPEFTAPKKIPMPRPMNEWLRDWCGPVRPEFYPHCTDDMTGDQRWLIWALERYLDLIDGE